MYLFAFKSRIDDKSKRALDVFNFSFLISLHIKLRDEINYYDKSKVWHAKSKLENLETYKYIS